jgi:hypothetical protein
MILCPGLVPRPIQTYCFETCLARRFHRVPFAVKALTQKPDPPAPPAIVLSNSQDEQDTTVARTVVISVAPTERGHVGGDWSLEQASAVLLMREYNREMIW